MAERLKLVHSANQFWINTVLQNTEKKSELKGSFVGKSCFNGFGKQI